ncbi:MAG: hypothetical protein AAF198_01555 [Pseudomonadota bacterium]
MTYRKTKSRGLSIYIAILICMMSSVYAGDGPGDKPTLKNSYTSIEFSRLSREEALALVNSMRNIIGFDGFVESTWFREMLKADRRAMQRLVAKMDKVKGKEKRIKTLQDEKKRVNKYIKKLEASIKRLNERNTEFARSVARSEAARLRAQKEYLRGVNNWIRNPSQGTIKE